MKEFHNDAFKIEKTKFYLLIKSEHVSRIIDKITVLGGDNVSHALFSCNVKINIEQSKSDNLTKIYFITENEIISFNDFVKFILHIDCYVKIWSSDDLSQMFNSAVQILKKEDIASFSDDIGLAFVAYILGTQLIILPMKKDFLVEECFDMNKLISLVKEKCDCECVINSKKMHITFYNSNFIDEISIVCECIESLFNVKIHSQIEKTYLFNALYAHGLRNELIKLSKMTRNRDYISDDDAVMIEKVCKDIDTRLQNKDFINNKSFIVHDIINEICNSDEFKKAPAITMKGLKRLKENMRFNAY